VPYISDLSIAVFKGCKEGVGMMMMMMESNSRTMNAATSSFRARLLFLCILFSWTHAIIASGVGDGVVPVMIQHSGEPQSFSCSSTASAAFGFTVPPSSSGLISFSWNLLHGTAPNTALMARSSHLLHSTSLFFFPFCTYFTNVLLMGDMGV
jgi:hypothetical protein